jgi:hypothetical protein
MDLFEDFADLHDTEPTPQMRRYYAHRYRELIGVHPDQRQELREALQRVVNGGGSAVNDVIDLIRRAYENTSRGLDSTRS